MSNERPEPEHNPSPPPQGGWSLPALLIGVAVTVGMTVYPHAVSRPDGSPDMLAATLLFWAMSAGFVRGVGFVPNFLILRAILSLPAALAALTVAIWRIASV